MFKLNVFTPLALVAGLLASMAAPSPAMAQQAYAYNNPFDDAVDDDSDPNDDGTDLVMTGLWAVDSTPAIAANNAPGSSGGNSLNWNNGVDFSGGTITGTARTDTINLTGVQSGTMTFYCWYNTEGGGTYDQKWIRIFNATSGGQVYQQQIYQGATAEGNCSGVSTWHQHSWANIPAAALNIPIQIEFFFNAVDQGGNNGQGWFVDDLVLITADATPPATITSLAASAPTLSGCQLDWNSPFDNDTSGQAASFDLRYATAPITESNFAQATTINGEPLPGPPPTPHTVTLAGLNPGTQYYFAIRTTDYAGNISLISNVATVTTVALPPTTGGGSATEAAPLPKDRFSACAAGTVAGPTGLLVIGGLLAAAASLKGFLRRKR